MYLWQSDNQWWQIFNLNWPKSNVSVFYWSTDGYLSLHLLGPVCSSLLRACQQAQETPPVFSYPTFVSYSLSPFITITAAFPTSLTSPNASLIYGLAVLPGPRRQAISITAGILCNNGIWSNGIARRPAVLSQLSNNNRPPESENIHTLEHLMLLHLSVETRVFNYVLPRAMHCFVISIYNLCLSHKIQIHHTQLLTQASS